MDFTVFGCMECIQDVLSPNTYFVASCKCRLNLENIADSVCLDLNKIQIKYYDSKNDLTYKLSF